MATPIVEYYREINVIQSLGPITTNVFVAQGGRPHQVFLTKTALFSTTPVGLEMRLAMMTMTTTTMVMMMKMMMMLVMKMTMLKTKGPAKGSRMCLPVLGVNMAVTVSVHRTSALRRVSVLPRHGAIKLIQVSASLCTT